MGLYKEKQWQNPSNRYDISEYYLGGGFEDRGIELDKKYFRE
jgi:hypothetical protein